MNTLKFFFQTAGRLAKQAWQLPHTIASATRARREQSVLDEIEAERLDRIRNPSKYLGKQ